MYFSNLAHPRWYLIPCEKSFAAHVMCEYPIETTDFTMDRQWFTVKHYNNFLQHVKTVLHFLKNTCPRYFILSDNRCLQFVRHNYSFTALNHQIEKQTNESENIFKVLEYLSKVNSLKPTFVFIKGWLFFLSS